MKLVLQGIAPEWLSDAPRGSLDELLEAFQEQEVDEENFIWPLSLEDETENEAELKSLDPFLAVYWKTLNRLILQACLKDLSGILYIGDTQTGLVKRR